MPIKVTPGLCGTASMNIAKIMQRVCYKVAVLKYEGNGCYAISLPGESIVHCLNIFTNVANFITTSHLKHTSTTLQSFVKSIISTSLSLNPYPVVFPFDR
jgi:hypothetical protein